MAESPTKEALESAQRAIENFENLIPQIRADLEALRERMRQAGISVPNAVSLTPEPVGTGTYAIPVGLPEAPSAPSARQATVYYVRHGWSCANQKKINVGFGTQAMMSDPALHCKGIKQAQLFGEELKDLPIDLVCTSQLLRSIQTGILLRGYKNTELQIVPYMNEKGNTFDNTPSKFKKLLKDQTLGTLLKIKDIAQDTKDKSNFKKFESEILPGILTSIDKEEPLTIFVITHAYILRDEFGVQLDNTQYIQVDYSFSPENGKIINRSVQTDARPFQTPYMKLDFDVKSEQCSKVCNETFFDYSELFNKANEVLVFKEDKTPLNEEDHLEQIKQQDSDTLAKYLKELVKVDKQTFVNYKGKRKEAALEEIRKNIRPILQKYMPATENLSRNVRGVLKGRMDITSLENALAVFKRVPTVETPKTSNKKVSTNKVSNKKVSPSLFAVNVLPQNFDVFGNLTPVQQPFISRPTVGQGPQISGNSTSTPPLMGAELNQLESNLSKNESKIGPNKSPTKKSPLSSTPPTHPTIYNNKKPILSKEQGSRTLTEKTKDANQLRQELFEQLQRLIDIYDKRYIFGNKEADLEKVRAKIRELLPQLQAQGEPTSNKEYLYDVYFGTYSSSHPLRVTGNGVKQNANTKATKAKSIFNKTISNNSKTRKNKKVSPSLVGPSYKIKGLEKAFAYNQPTPTPTTTTPTKNETLYNYLKELDDINKTSFLLNQKGTRKGAALEKVRAKIAPLLQNLPSTQEQDEYIRRILLNKARSVSNIERRIRLYRKNPEPEPQPTTRPDAPLLKGQTGHIMNKFTLNTPQQQPTNTTKKPQRSQLYDMIIHPILESYFQTNVNTTSNKFNSSQSLYYLLDILGTLQISDTSNEIMDSILRYRDKQGFIIDSNIVQTDTNGSGKKTVPANSRIVSHFLAGIADELNKDGTNKLKQQLTRVVEPLINRFLRSNTTQQPSARAFNPTQQPSARAIAFDPTKVRKGGKRKSRKVKRSTKRKTRKH
jgi:broad specificity phosphatase PhoE